MVDAKVHRSVKFRASKDETTQRKGAPGNTQPKRRRKKGRRI